MIGTATHHTISAVERAVLGIVMRTAAIAVERRLSHLRTSAT